jgi:transketolase
VDRNRIQNDGFGDYARLPESDRRPQPGGWVRPDGYTVNIMSLEPLAEKWQAFGWHTREVDGHDLEQIIDALMEARSVKGKPSVIIAHTVKGKGVSFMENNPSFHGRAPSPEQLQQALAELA